jgi:hypothetical protein
MPVPIGSPLHSPELLPRRSNQYDRDGQVVDDCAILPQSHLISIQTRSPSFRRLVHSSLANLQNVARNAALKLHIAVMYTS